MYPCVYEISIIMDQILPITPPPAILIKDFKDTFDWGKLEDKIKNTPWDSGINFDVTRSKQFFNESLIDIKKQIETECELFTKHICPIDFNFELAMTSSWVNSMQLGQSHPWHSHPFSIVSGVIFLDDNPENLNLMFKTSMKDAVPPYSILELDYFTSLKDLNESDANLQYHMVLFYSNVLHSVPPLTTSNQRRTISFNTFWSGQVDFGDPLNSHNFK
jgi:uncharacterized protein (TIGR02466 family)